MGSRQKNEKWASDEDANDLLAGILDETEQDARSEQERIEAELAARDREQRRRQEEQRERKRAEAKARITAEQERLEGLEKRRTLRQEALRIEELEELGEYVEPEPEEASKPSEETLEAQRESDEVEQRREEQRRLRETADMLADETAVSSPSNTNKMPMIALAAVLALVAGAAIMAFALTQGSYEPDSSTYTKSVYEPREPRDMQVSVGFTPINKVEEASPEKPETRSPRPAPARDNPRPAATTTASEDSEEEDDHEPLIIDDEGFDPFSEGF
ncbi:MAG: hypothetical protein ACQEVA_10420 [Myxococcota bacterium]